MENKKTTELIDELNSLKETDYESNGKYEKLIAELREREPFLQILGEDWDDSLPAVWEAIQEIREAIKLLKRHKHDEKTGDVMVRV
jgi:hypothetical protein